MIVKKFAYHKTCLISCHITKKRLDLQKMQLYLSKTCLDLLINCLSKKIIALKKYLDPEHSIPYVKPGTNFLIRLFKRIKLHAFFH